VEEHKQKELKLKKIEEIYTKYHNEPSSDRRQAYLGQLWEWVFKLCRRHIFYTKTEKMGVEIVDEVKLCAGKNKTPEEFMKDLEPALYTARNLSYRNRVEGAIREPRIIKRINKIIEDGTMNKGRELTPDEKVDYISRYIPLRKETILEHLISMDRKIINYVQYKEEGKEVGVVESMADHSITMKKPVSAPEKEAMENIEAEIIKNALETVINKYHDKMEPFYRALFTMRYIKNNMNYEKLRPILSADILEMFEKNGKIPAQYKIYMIYHPNAEKSTAETNASQMSKKLYADMKNAIKEKYPDFKF
jgi:hypothetical protein